jgi:hypothetical protein
MNSISIKSASVLFLSLILTFALVQPIQVFAKNGSDDGDSHGMNSGHEDDDEDNDHGGRHNDDDDDDNGSEDDSSRSNSLEAEADVFTDMTIVKVELPSGRKVIFETSADTRSEVLDEIVSRFDLTRDEVDAVLSLEIEDRASRARDRQKINSSNRDDNDDVCTVNSRRLEVEADVFTDTTVVKVERNGTTTVFETGATTTEGVIAAVVNRFDVTSAQVNAVLDFEVEDRASRVSDFAANSLGCDNINNDTNNGESIKDLERKVERLRELLQRLLDLLARL